ncbi:MAG: hypothetical protein CMP25_00785 [Rickettsiales bacterium]|nr:hypothetical protein [Rickettsiales bacterium]|tara:strand:- start:2360 stop:3295 length:936 start_codon:yes stop_codon:yes gene_type:complete
MKNIDRNIFAAIDLGSNNCRLIITQCSFNDYKILDTFSSTIKLGKNLSYSGEFSNEQITKTVDVFEKISKKLDKFEVEAYRCIATQACREAINTEKLVREVKAKTGILVEVISPKEEARLCLKSCFNYKDFNSENKLIFDIGGGSTEIIYKPKYSKKSAFNFVSIPTGVINFDQKMNLYSEQKTCQEIQNEINFFKNTFMKVNVPFSTIGSCSTITSLCAIHKNLKFYKKEEVEGYNFQILDIYLAIKKVQQMSDEEKKNNKIIGLSRKLLLENGIKILNLILKSFEIESIFVSDRGIKEGIIWDIINQKN